VVVGVGVGAGVGSGGRGSSPSEIKHEAGSRSHAPMPGWV
jgi:hypothetical protein